MTPPEQCTRCRHLETWRVGNIPRHLCLRGQPMHPDCGWFKQSNESITGENPHA